MGTQVAIEDGSPKRDHGGGLDAARAKWGGDDWIDLSTGINPHPYPIPSLSARDWTALPDEGAVSALTAAARAFWKLPSGVDILAAPGASALIAQLPRLAPGKRVTIPAPTYNEHAAAFTAHGFELAPDADALVLVHPNNPDGALRSQAIAPFTVIDESFCDVTPDASRVTEARRPGVVVLKSFGKFWGLAGLRLGFAIGHPTTLAPLADALGPWPVSGPALRIGATALRDTGWADATRKRLAQDAARLDRLMTRHGDCVGGTDLFRLYDVGRASEMQDRLARSGIWTRIFPYSDRWIRLGLPPSDAWARLEAALA